MGAGGSVSTSMDAATIGNNPYLFQHTFTGLAGLAGETVRFKLQATNDRGSTTSDSYLSALIAGPPSTPTQGPQDVPSITSG